MRNIYSDMFIPDAKLLNPKQNVYRRKKEKEKKKQTRHLGKIKTELKQKTNKLRFNANCLIWI